MDFDRCTFRRKGRPVAGLSGGLNDAHVVHSTQFADRNDQTNLR